MARKKDLTGQQFGRLTVLNEDTDAYEAHYKTTGQRRVFWRCRCECGNEKVTRSYYLVGGKTKSCGCFQQENRETIHITHGKSGTDTHIIWCGIRARCLNENTPAFNHYGGRGIKICDRWGSFENFLSDMGERPSKKHSIERVDSNKGYEPDNCIWALWVDQANNTSRNHRIEYNGMNMTTAQWSREIGVNVHTIQDRIGRGLPVEKVLHRGLIDKTSVSRGVHLNKGRGKKFKATISVKSKTINLGLFDTKQEAIQARMDAEIQYRGKHDAVNQR